MDLLENNPNNACQTHLPVPVAGMQDFNYLATNAFEITLELGCDKYPKASDLEKEWERNREALIAFLWAAHGGIRGTVSDNAGFLENAVISVVNITGPVPRPIRHDVTTGKNVKPYCPQFEINILFFKCDFEAQTYKAELR